MRTALLLIDLQNDYFPGGAMELDGADAAVARCSQLLEAFRSRGLPRVHIRHVSTRAGATFFVPGTRGVEIHPAVTPRDDETVFCKHFPNAFRDTPLLEHLRAHAITQLVIAGMMTQMCIDTSTRAASDMGFQCTLAHDGCATRAQSFGGRTVGAADVQAAFMASLNGLFAKVMTADEAIAVVQLGER